MSLKAPILLSSVWLLHASLMPPNAPPDERERVRGNFYEPMLAIWPTLYRLAGSVLCLAEVAVTFAANYPSPLSSEVLSRLVLSEQLPSFRVNRYFFAGFVLVAVGGLGRIWCYRTLGRHFTFRLSVRKEHRLITNGPYAFVRHPSYLGLLLIAVGMSLMIASPGSFARRCGWLGTTFGRLVIGVWGLQSLSTWGIAYSRSQREDTFLREHFREEWDSYSQRVKYRIFPGVY